MKRELKKRADVDGPDADEIELAEKVTTAHERIESLPIEELCKRNANMRAVLHLLSDPPKASDYRGQSIEQAVSKSAQIYADALAEEIAQADFDAEKVTTYAVRVWRANLPDLLDRASARQYVACVAWGMKYGLIDANEAKSMMYIAQNLLTVLRIEVEHELKQPKPKQLESMPLFIEGQVTPKPTEDVG